jgi:hypothetical protein
VLRPKRSWSEAWSPILLFFSFSLWSLITSTSAGALAASPTPPKDEKPQQLVSLAVPRGSFLASAHRELSEALVQSQGDVYYSCALLLAKASGRPVLPGADTPKFDLALCGVCGVCVLVATGFCTTQCCSRCFRFLAFAFHPYDSFCLLSALLSIVTSSPTPSKEEKPQ